MDQRQELLSARVTIDDLRADLAEVSLKKDRLATHFKTLALNPRINSGLCCIFLGFFLQDYDYLLNMSMWYLTQEKQDEEHPGC